jgi:hypothetical protein
MCNENKTRPCLTIGLVLNFFVKMTGTKNFRNPKSQSQRPDEKFHNTNLKKEKVRTKMKSQTTLVSTSISTFP